jgi:mannosyltransferase OCH1-like enzyme
MIPKTIHYCWFGGNELPPLAKKCIKSWKKYCKGYKIIKWDESNFDISSAPLYVRQAYDAKKWAFVSDYVRLWAMVNYGGIYMDTDVEVVKPLDNFLNQKAFSGFEDEKNIPTGIMACEKNFSLFVRFLHYYDDALFYDDFGNITYVTNVTIITNACIELGLVQNNQKQAIEGFTLYPNDYFCPKSYTDGIVYKTNNTVTIHHFNSSWHSKEENERKIAKWRERQKKKKIKKKKEKRKRRRSKIKNLFICVFGENIYKRIRG